jgi:hypothetical protein
MLSILLLAAAQQAPSSDPEHDFHLQVESAAPLYGKAGSAARALMLQGRVSDAVQAFLDVVPEGKRTPAHEFLLGTNLFALDFAQARQAHERAFAAAPDVMLVASEMAIVLHRAAEYAKAEPLYARVVASEEFEGGAMAALRADCLLHLGRLPEAVRSWMDADPRSNHSGIEEAFSWVYGHESPWVRRDRLLAKVRAGDADAAEELILLDLSFDQDWWNVQVERDCLDLDLPLAAKALGAESASWRELELLAQCAGSEDANVPPELRRVLEKRDEAHRAAVSSCLDGAKTLGLLGEGAHLPRSSRVASSLFGHWTSTGIAKAAELLTSFEDELWKRVGSEKGDLQALEILGVLYQETSSPRLAEADELGWTSFHDPRFGCSLLARRGEGLRPDDPLLVDALARHAQDARVLAFAVHAARKAGTLTPELLARQIQAELRHLQSYLSVKDLFAELAALVQPK